MPRRTSRLVVSGEYFRWVLFQNPNGRYYADGRGNNSKLRQSGALPLDRYSLSATNQQKAISEIHKLDRVMAVERGIAPPTVLLNQGGGQVSIASGIQQYMLSVSRPTVSGGAGAPTAKRYKPVFDKLQQWCASNNISSWNQFGESTLDAYLAWLDSEDYSLATEFLEGTTIKQCVKHLIKINVLPPTSALKNSLKRPTGTTTYCYTVQEVQAMIELCDADPDLHWLSLVIVGLSHTGLRISELASLKWSDFDFNQNLIVLTHGGHIGTAQQRKKARKLKGKRSRTISLHPTLRDRLLSVKSNQNKIVFAAQQGGALHPDNLRNVLKRDVLEKLKSKFPKPADEQSIVDGRLHSFRHFFCSIAALTPRMTPQILMDWLGHRDSQMIHHYFHPNREHSAGLMSTIQILPTSESGALPDKKLA